MNDENAFVNLLTNQIDNVIIPRFLDYQEAINNLSTSSQNLSTELSEENISEFITAYKNAYLQYQAVAVHNYFATETQGLVINTNLYPIDITILDNLVETESYNFSLASQERANGFPVIDFMIFHDGQEGFISYLEEDNRRLIFLNELVINMKDRADRMIENWTGSLRMNFIENGGTALGSSISVQLNNSIIYYEEHIRENKVGIPIGLIGPNDSPIPPDPTKIEAFYEAESLGNEEFTLDLLSAAIQEMEFIYQGGSGQGYDDLLIEREQEGIDNDIKDLFQRIQNEINNRTSISGNEDLYNVIQELVTLYKTDLFPVLNVQDADGASDGD